MDDNLGATAGKGVGTGFAAAVTGAEGRTGFATDELTSRAAKAGEFVGASPGAEDAGDVNAAPH